MPDRPPVTTSEETTTDPAPKRRLRLRTGVQLVGAAAGVGLAAWAISMALGEQNTESLDALRAAPGWAIAALLALSAAHVTLNGVLFWVALRPLERAGRVPRISLGRVVLVNTLPTFLAILPFKLGFAVRLALHNRVDGVAPKALAGWMIAFAGLSVATLVPAGVSGFLAEGPLWWALLFVLPGAGLLLCGIGAHALRGTKADDLSLGAGLVARDVRALALTYLLRCVDIGVQGGRFFLAASLAGVVLEPGEALLLAASYFLIVAVAPAGALGVAEVGTAGIAAAVGLGNEALALVALVVSGVHYATAGAMSLPAAYVIWRGRRALVRPAGEPPAVHPGAAGPLESG